MKGPGGATLASSRDGALSWAQDLHVLGFLTGFAVLAMAWAYPIWGAAWAFVCPLRELTGIPCPTCYGTRALVAVVAGHVFSALQLNPLVAASGVGLMAYLPLSAAVIAGGWPRPRLSTRTIARLGRAGIALVVANWVYLVSAHAGIFD